MLCFCLKVLRRKYQYVNSSGELATNARSMAYTRHHKRIVQSFLQIQSFEVCICLHLLVPLLYQYTCGIEYRIAPWQLSCRLEFKDLGWYSLAVYGYTPRHQPDAVCYSHILSMQLPGHVCWSTYCPCVLFSPPSLIGVSLFEQDVTKSSCHTPTP